MSEKFFNLFFYFLKISSFLAPLDGRPVSRGKRETLVVTSLARVERTSVINMSGQTDPPQIPLLPPFLTFSKPFYPRNSDYLFCSLKFCKSLPFTRTLKTSTKKMSCLISEIRSYALHETRNSGNQKFKLDIKTNFERNHMDFLKFHEIIWTPM